MMKKMLIQNAGDHDSTSVFGMIIATAMMLNDEVSTVDDRTTNLSSLLV